jgi:subtilisin family serine protease
MKIKDGLLSPAKLEHTVEEISSWEIRNVFATYGVTILHEVFKNRYDSKGKLKANPARPYSLQGWQEIPFNSRNHADQFIREIKNVPGIENALIEVPVPLRAAVEPNDPEYTNSHQWHLNNPANPDADIDAPAAWDINKGRNDVIVAILDGGVDYHHADLDLGDRSRVIAGTDTGDDDGDPLDDLPYDDPESFAGHGTSVAGVVGAITNNGSEVAGVMWNCKIMPVKMVGGGEIKVPFIYDWNWDRTAFPSDVADAIDYAVNNGANVINLSYGFPDMGWALDEVILRIPLIFQSIDNAYKHNVVITAAMGNEYESGNPVDYPAGFYEQVIPVGASNQSANRASFSNTGSHISVVAPGQNIYTTARGGGVTSVSGTSFSSPITAGVAGLVISQGLDRGFNLTNNDVKHILELTAFDITPAGFDNETGYGIVNARNALQLLAPPNVVVHATSTGGTATQLQTISQWILLDNRWGLAAASYASVDQYKVTKHVSFDIPFCYIPSVWMRERGSKSLSYANPNSGHPFAIISNVTKTGFDLEYVTYFVHYNMNGQAVNQWVR